MERDSSYATELETERRMKDEFMARHTESPFVENRIADFAGLQYFPIDIKFRVTARLRRLPIPQEAYLRTNRDGQAVMRYLGDLEFELEGRNRRLRVYHAGEGVGSSVFVPFRDATSGSESYGPGRYVTLDLTSDDLYDLDFNRAFNPYCAYTDAYECGFPPAENDLPVAIRAGEKVWSQARNPATPSSAVLRMTEEALAKRRRADPASGERSARSSPGKVRTARRQRLHR